MRSAILAPCLVLIAAACQVGNDECPATFSNVKISLNGADVSQGADGCGHTIGPGIVATFEDRWEVQVDSSSEPGTYHCDYETGAHAYLTDLEDPGTDRMWQAGVGALNEATCTYVVNEQANGAPVSGTFEGTLMRGNWDGGIDEAKISFTFHIPPVE